MMKKVLVVGAGLSGLTFARLAAEDGYQVDIIEQRDHIGGLCISSVDKNTGVNIHVYGPHIFHTNRREVADFISRFTDLNNYVHRVWARHKGRYYDYPINLHTINKFFGTNYSPVEACGFLETVRMKKSEYHHFEDYLLGLMGDRLYQAFIKNYTRKQWGMSPSELTVSAACRIPVTYSEDSRFFKDTHQGIPEKGYEALFEKMSDHKRIQILLKTPFEKFKENWKKKYTCLIYTGSIDDYFKGVHGWLPYRSVKFEKSEGNWPIIQNAVINECDYHIPYTRVHEPAYFSTDHAFKRSVCIKEYPCHPSNPHERYYPVLTRESTVRLKKYLQLAALEEKVTFLGRLGTFKYLNMDEAIHQAMHAYKISGLKTQQPGGR